VASCEPRQCVELADDGDDRLAASVGADEAGRLTRHADVEREAGALQLLLEERTRLLLLVADLGEPPDLLGDAGVMVKARVERGDDRLGRVGLSPLCVRGGGEQERHAGAEGAGQREGALGRTDERHGRARWKCPANIRGGMSASIEVRRRVFAGATASCGRRSRCRALAHVTRVPSPAFRFPPSASRLPLPAARFPRRLPCPVSAPLRVQPSPSASANSVRCVEVELGIPGRVPSAGRCRGPRDVRHQDASGRSLRVHVNDPVLADPSRM
jgi:hypothetical protein